MEFLATIFGFAVVIILVIIWMKISDFFWDKVDDVVSVPFEAMGNALDKNAARKKLSVPHQFRLRAPVEHVQQTLDNLPGIPNQPIAGRWGPFYQGRTPGGARFGITVAGYPNAYDIDVTYLPDPFGVIGELRFHRWPDHALDDADDHERLINTVMGELSRLDPLLEVRRPVQQA